MKTDAVKKTMYIAIVTCFDASDYDSGDYSPMIATSITNWDEVTEAEYEILGKWIHKYPSKRLIRRSDAEEVVSTIADCIAAANKSAIEFKASIEKRAAIEAARKKKSQEKQLAKSLKTEEDRRKMFELLKDEFKDKP